MPPKKTNCPQRKEENLHHMDNVGKPNPEADNGLICYPLDFEELKSMKASERNVQVVRRLNYIYSSHRLWRLFKIDAVKLEKSQDNPPVQMDFPESIHPIELPLKKLQSAFPDISETTERIILAKKELFPDEAKACEVFDASIESFKETELCKRLKDLAEDTFKQVTCKKFVAFGGAAICSYIKPPIRAHYQHAALLAIREAWEMENGIPKIHGRATTPIFIQDPQYMELDAKVAQNYGMTVVNGNLGHQLGFVEVDDETLVVDLITCFPLINATLEYTRPAAILSPFVIESSDFPNTPLYRTLNVNNEPGSIVVPASNLNGSKNFERLVKDYEKKEMPITELEVGNPKDSVFGRDGDRGNTYIGNAPTMYVRRK